MMKRFHRQRERERDSCVGISFYMWKVLHWIITMKKHFWQSGAQFLWSSQRRMKSKLSKSSNQKATLCPRHGLTCVSLLSPDRVNLRPFISVDSQQSIQITAWLIKDDSDEKMSAEIKKRRRRRWLDKDWPHWHEYNAVRDLNESVEYLWNYSESVFSSPVRVCRCLKAALLSSSSAAVNHCSTTFRLAFVGFPPVFRLPRRYFTVSIRTFQTNLSLALWSV